MLGFLTRHAKLIVAIFALAMFGLTQHRYDGDHWYKFQYNDNGVIWFQNANWVQQVDGFLIDKRFQMRGSRPADANVQLIGIQNTSLTLDALAPEEIDASEALKLMKKQWPWSRKVHALLLEKLMAAGAKVVVFDIIFKGEMEDDQEFAKVLHKYKDRVAICSVFDEVLQNQGTQYVLPPDSIVIDRSDPIVGYANAALDLDGVYRRNRCQPVLASGDDMALAGLAAKKFEADVEFPPRDHSNLINFHGPAGTFDPLPIENIFVDKLWAAPPYEGGKAFQNKIVIVGPMASALHDDQQTPFGTMFGPEVQANRIASLLQHSSIQDSSERFDFFLSLGMTLIALCICLFIRNVFLKGVFLVAVAAGFAFTCQWVFTNQNLAVSMVPPIFCFTTTGAFGMFFQYILAWFEKHRLNNVLEKYVSKNVAKTILKNPKSFVESLTGRKQQVAILFCDIRGFTTMTESSDANELVAQLNEYFSKMVHLIEEEKGGTLQKFIGDAIMAAWGDTIVRGGETDVRLAVEAALGMRAALIKLNEGWKDKPNRNPLSIGIGINYGEVVVGNIGSANRMEFTVLGDGINLAARFESSTKQFHTDLLVGEAAEALVRDHFVFRKVGLITFKGKTKPVEVFAVLSDKTIPAPEWLATYHEALMLFRQREFTAAVERFKCAEKMIGSEDFLCGMYVKACADYAENPPPENWDGVFVLKDK